MSIRDRIGPYDSIHLADKYAQKLSIHDYNTDGKTQLLFVVDMGKSFSWKQGIEVTLVSRDAKTGQYRVQVIVPKAARVGS